MTLYMHRLLLTMQIRFKFMRSHWLRRQQYLHKRKQVTTK